MEKFLNNPDIIKLAAKIHASNGGELPGSFKEHFGDIEEPQSMEDMGKFMEDNMSRMGGAMSSSGIKDVLNKHAREINSTVKKMKPEDLKALGEDMVDDDLLSEMKEISEKQRKKAQEQGPINRGGRSFRGPAPRSSVPKGTVPKGPKPAPKASKDEIKAASEEPKGIKPAAPGIIEVTPDMIPAQVSTAEGAPGSTPEAVPVGPKPKAIPKAIPKIPSFTKQQAYNDRDLQKKIFNAVRGQMRTGILSINKKLKPFKYHPMSIGLELSKKFPGANILDISPHHLRIGKFEKKVVTVYYTLTKGAKKNKTLSKLIGLDVTGSGAITCDGVDLTQKDIDFLVAKSVYVPEEVSKETEKLAEETTEKMTEALKGVDVKKMMKDTGKMMVKQIKTMINDDEYQRNVKEDTQDEDPDILESLNIKPKPTEEVIDEEVIPEKTTETKDFSELLDDIEEAEDTEEPKNIDDICEVVPMDKLGLPNILVSLLSPVMEVKIFSNNKDVDKAKAEKDEFIDEFRKEADMYFKDVFNNDERVKFDEVVEDNEEKDPDESDSSKLNSLSEILEKA